MKDGSGSTTRGPPECAHYWRLTDQPDGQTSMGTCAKCGRQRQFLNFVRTEAEKGLAADSESNGEPASTVSRQADNLDLRGIKLGNNADEEGG